MPAPHSCPECGTPVPPEGPARFCPVCALRGALAFGSDTAAAQVPVRPQPRVIGDYELVEELARGGMGVVFKARQISLNRTVALKMILSGHLASATEVQRFRLEAEAAARLRHPNIVAVHGIGEQDGQHFFSMDYIEGKNLAELVRDNPLPAARAATYLKTIAEAIHYAHEHGVLHRDLKPSNVLIDTNDQPRITDFGLAKRLVAQVSQPAVSPTSSRQACDRFGTPEPTEAAQAGSPATQQTGSLRYTDTLTLSGQAMGSPHFMSPEQAAGRREQIAAPSDVYSLGALLYHLLTGRPPFVSEVLQDLFDQVRNREPVSPRTLNPRVPRDLETICLKCLEKEPPQRYQSARKLAEDLDRFLRSEPILAKPVGPAGKLWRWSKRNPKVATLGALLLAVGGLGFAAVLWQWQRADHARAQAMRHAQAEALQRQRAVTLLNEAELRQAETAFDAGEATSALTYLARVLRRDPSNRVAAERILAALAQRHFALPLTPLLRHQGPVRSAQFSPDGRRVLTASDDGSARVWDAGTGQPITPPLRHGDAVRCAQFSPDGTRVVTAGEDNLALVWDAQSGQARTLPMIHLGTVRSACLSPDGQRIVTASSDQTARIWDARTGLALTPSLRHSARVLSAHFSPDGTNVLTRSEDKTARIWDGHTGAPITDPLRHEAEVTAIELSSDRQRLLTAADDGILYVRDVRTGQPLFEPLRHGNGIREAHFSPHGQWIVTASDDKTARVWDAHTGQPLSPPLPHGHVVMTASFSPEGLRVVTGSADKTARVWDAHTGRPLTEPFRHQGQVQSARFSPDGHWVLTASWDGTAQVWDVRDSRARTEPLTHAAGVWMARFSPDGRRIVTGSADSTARIWDARMARLLTPPLVHTGAVQSVQFSPNGPLVLTVCGRSALAWDADTGRLLHQSIHHELPIKSAQFSPDGERVLTASGDAEVRLWEAQTGQPLGQPLRHRRAVDWAEFSPDGLRIVTASQDNFARLWDAQTGRFLFDPLRHDADVYCAQFSPDGQYVLTASADTTARLWDAQTGRLLRKLPHGAAVRAARFSRHGPWAVTLAGDNTIRVWDVRTGGLATGPFEDHFWNSARDFNPLSPDGSRLLRITATNEVRLWDVPSGHFLSEPLAHGAQVTFAEFSADGQQIVTASLDGAARVWYVPAVTGPIPDWLPQLAEAIAGQRFTDQGAIEPVPLELVLALKRRLAPHAPTNTVTHWANWFFADRATRPLSPHSAVTVGDYIERRLASDRLPDLEEALKLSPTNALVMARLARRILNETAQPPGNQLVLADWYSRRAAELAPNQAEVLQIRAAIAERLAKARPP